MILILDCGSSKVPYIEEAVDDHSDFQTVPILEFESDNLLNYKGVIISGAPLLITEQDMIPFLDKLTWIKETTLPVLGICFGHQLIGLTFGAYGSRMREDRDWQMIEIFELSVLFERMPSEFEMMEDHCESISVPPGFKLLASSDSCVNEAMEHKSLPIYGIQFHPEVSGNLGRVIFDNFCRVCEKMS